MYLAEAMDLLIALRLIYYVAILIKNQASTF